jgi:DNA mismatch repair protein MutH
MVQRPNKEDAFNRLTTALMNRNLYALAGEFGIVVQERAHINKGWVGQTVERAAGLELSNVQERDGLDFELKTTTLFQKDRNWLPQETIKVTQLNPSAILEESFETSKVWEKLSSLILVGVEHVTPTDVRVVCIRKLEVTDQDLVSELKACWEEIQHTVSSGDIIEYFNVGTSEQLLQLRPTGSGKNWSTCPITGEKFPARAFYATKKFIVRLLSY